MKNVSLSLLLAITVVVCGVFGFVYTTYNTPSTSNSTKTLNNNNTTNENTNTIRNTSGSNEYPKNVVASYLAQFNNIVPTADQFTYSSDFFTPKIETPFPRADYTGTITAYGVLFWKKGPMKKTIMKSFGTTPIEYEAGIRPDFRWYDFRTKKFTTLPTLQWNAGVATFDRVYEVHPSVTEPMILIEIGEYDIASPAFEPGLSDAQPVKTRGIIFNPRTSLFETGDPIQQFNTALKRTSTVFAGFHWDSLHQVAAAIPGGEGCGAYDTIAFIKLPSAVVTTYGGEGKLGFEKGICNPRNGVSPDGHWAILYGNTSATAGQVILYNVLTAKQEKIKLTAAFQDENWISTWDTSKTFPILTTKKNVTIDLNK